MAQMGTTQEPSAASPGSTRLLAYAALSGYILLSGLWFVLSACYLYTAQRRPGSGMTGAAIFLAGVGVLFVIWLKGFRLRIAGDELEYRNGFYRSVIINLSDISWAKNFWVKNSKGIPILRLAIKRASDGSIVRINIKPFKRPDLQFLMAELEKHSQAHDARLKTNRPHSPKSPTRLA